MPARLPINPEILRDQVMADCGITLNDLLSSSRHAKIVFARAIICSVLRMHTMLSLPEISKVIRSRHSGHGVVLDGVERVRAGKHDEDAHLVLSMPVTAMEYANFCYIRADEASQVRDPITTIRYSEHAA